jgi:hypothetical protein
MIQEFPDVSWIAAHMGGAPENPDHLEKLLGLYPNLSFDTSATKWQVREMSLHSQQMKRLICRYPDRFLFGSDLVTRPGLSRDHYVSRYWCQRTLLESDWRGQSPIDSGRAQFAGRGAGVGLSRQRAAALAVMSGGIGGCRCRLNSPRS